MWKLPPLSRQLIDRLKSEAHPLCSCLSCCSPVSGKRSCFRAVSRRDFRLSCSRVFLWLHFLVIPRSNLLANQDDTFIGNLEAGFLRMLSFVWFYLDLDLPTWRDIQRTGPCSCSPSLLPSTISHRRLANVLFAFYYLAFILCYFLGRIKLWGG